MNSYIHRLLFIRLLLLSLILCVKCMQEESTNLSHDEEHNVWSRYDNDITKKIMDSQREYNVSNQNVYSSLKAIMDTDLKSFKNGITHKMVEAASPYGTRYQLINHTLYRHKDCLFPSRCEGVEHFLLKLVNLSDFEIIVNTRDYPQISKHFNTQIPIFSFSKTDEYADIMYPAWSFWCGGPAISLYPTGIGRWDKVRKSVMKETEKWPWEKKKQIAFFRGSRTSSERDELIYLSRESPDLIDAAYTKNQAWKSKKDTLNADPAQEVTFEEHCHYKYLFNFRGVAASFRFKHLFLCKSLVFHVGDEWQEYFYSLLKPWVHYIPVASEYKKEDVRKILEFFKRHDDLAKTIAENGFNFVKEHLRLSKVTWYWRTLLKKYINLQKFTPNLNQALKKVS